MASGRFTKMGLQHADQTSVDPFAETHLSRKDKKLQRTLQRKVELYDQAEGIRHPATGPQAHPPRIVIVGTDSDARELAEYDHWEGATDGKKDTILISRAAARDRNTRDFNIAHEVAHENEANEQKADVMAARVVGPQKAIDSLRRMSKTDPESDDPVIVATDPLQHGTLKEREQNIEDSFPKQKFNHSENFGRVTPCVVSVVQRHEEQGSVDSFRSTGPATMTFAADGSSKRVTGSVLERSSDTRIPRSFAVGVATSGETKAGAAIIVPLDPKGNVLEAQPRREGVPAQEDVQEARKMANEVTSCITRKPKPYSP